MSDEQPHEHVGLSGMTHDTSPPYGFTVCRCGWVQGWTQIEDGSVIEAEWEPPPSTDDEKPA